MAAAIAILKGLRFPVTWAASQAQADYREGFLKRGLFGELCRLAHLNIADYRIFASLSLAILAVFLLLFLHFARTAGMHAADGPLIALIAGSYCISYLVSMVGYLDIVLGILALAVLGMHGVRAQLCAAALVGCFAVLIHEMYAVVFLPLTLLPYLLQNDREPASTRRRLSRLWAAIAFALPWGAVVALTAHPALTAEQIARLQHAMMARVNFPAEPMIFDIYSMSALGNIRMMGRYIFTGSWVALQVLAMAAFLPTTLYFLLLSLRILPSASSRMLRFWLVMVVFAPLGMNLIAYDLYRWGALMLLNAILALLVIRRAQRSSMPTPATQRSLLTPAFRNAAYLLIALNLATNIGMFAHRGKDFPFYDYWSDFIAAKHSHGHWIHP